MEFLLEHLTCDVRNIAVHENIPISADVGDSFIIFTCYRAVEDGK
jgi:hypothetical protein